MKRLGILLASVALAIGLFAVDTAQPHQSAAAVFDCNGRNFSLVLYKNALNDPSPNCVGFNKNPNWNPDGYTLYDHPGPCSSHWNDCVSALNFSGSCHYGYTLFENGSYTNVLYTHWGNHTVSSMPFGFNDAASSLYLNYRSVCPSAPSAAQ